MMTFYSLLESHVFSEAASLNITMVTYGSPSQGLVFGLPYTLPAYRLAIQEVREEYGYHIDHVPIQAKSDYNMRRFG